MRLGGIFLLCVALAATGARGDDVLCESHVSRRAPFRVTKKWILDHALIAPEVTFTSPVLESMDPRKVAIKNPGVFSWQSFSSSTTDQLELKSLLVGAVDEEDEPSLSAEQAHEVVRYIVDVLGAEKLVFHLSSDITYDFFESVHAKIHKQQFTFEVYTKWGFAVILTLEPGCVEVNRAPVLRRDLRAHWQDIEASSHDNGFFAQSQTGVMGGGGTHMNFGWVNSDENLWLLRPDLLARFVEFPLIHPELFYLLNGEEDAGPHSSVVTPHEAGNAERANMMEFLLRLTSLHLNQASTAEVHDFLKSHVQPSVKKHNRYLSLKHIGAPNPFVEVRMHRSFVGLDEIEAAADLWLEAVYFLSKPRSFDWSKVGAARLTSAANINPLKMLDDTKRLFSDMKLPRVLQRRLFGINQIDADKPKYYDVSIHSGAKFKLNRAAAYLGSYEMMARIALELKSEFYNQDTVGIWFSSNAMSPMIFKDGALAVTMAHPPVGDQYSFVVIYDSKTNVLIDRFSIFAEPSIGGQAKLTLGIPVETAVADHQFDRRFFEWGLRTAGSFSFNKKGEIIRHGAKVDVGTLGQMMTSIKYALLRIPELAARLSDPSFDSSLGKTFALNVFFPSKEVPAQVEDIYINGIKVPFEKNETSYGISVRLELLKKYFPNLKSVNQKLSFHVAVYDKNDGVIDFIWTIDLENQETKIDFASSMIADKQHDLLLQLLANIPLPSEYNSVEGPQQFAGFLDQMFPEFSAANLRLLSPKAE